MIEPWTQAFFVIRLFLNDNIHYSIEFESYRWSTLLESHRNCDFGFSDSGLLLKFKVYAQSRGVGI